MEVIESAKALKLSYNIEELRNIASFFRNQKSGNLDSSIRACRNYIPKIREAWTNDPVATAYIEKLERKLNQLEKTVSIYDSVAQRFDESAAALESTRQRLLRQLNAMQ